MRVHAPVAAPPGWLIALLLPERPITAPRPPQRRSFWNAIAGTSIADRFTSATSRSEILAPHRWRCLDADPDADGARWRHPAATAAGSATIKNRCLFVYSPNTPFAVTESGDPHGYTKFRAYAVLNHGGDMKAAARAIINKDKP